MNFVAVSKLLTWHSALPPLAMAHMNTLWWQLQGRVEKSQEKAKGRLSNTCLPSHLPPVEGWEGRFLTPGNVQGQGIGSSLFLQRFELLFGSFEVTRKLLSSRDPGLSNKSWISWQERHSLYPYDSRELGQTLGIPQPGLVLTWAEGSLRARRFSALPACGCWDTAQSRTVVGRGWKGALGVPANVIGACRILWGSLMNLLK